MTRGIPRFAGEPYVASFGRQWNRYDVARDDEDEAVFRIKTGIDPDDLKGKLVLDAGCGGGRYARLVGRHGAHVVGVATGYRDDSPLQNRLFGFGSPKASFMEKFTDQEKRTEYHTSIPQALTMMNNEIVNEATNPDSMKAPVLSAIVSSSFMTTPQKIEAMVLATLSRKPTEMEARKYHDYVRKAGPRNEKKALSDVFWALLNSTEFKFIH